MAKLLNHCPTCHSRMEITQISCTACDTVILGRFEPCRFCTLEDADLNFLEAFLRSRGNVKEMERDLGISYWTIRTRLGELLDKLGYGEKPDQTSLKEKRRAILERVAKGELTSQEASRLLDALAGS